MEEEDKKILISLTQALKLIDQYPKKLFLRQFFLGLFSGLGATLGVTIVLAILSYLVHLLGGVPVIGQWFSRLGNYLIR